MRVPIAVASCSGVITSVAPSVASSWFLERSVRARSAASSTSAARELRLDLAHRELHGVAFGAVQLLVEGRERLVALQARAGLRQDLDDVGAVELEVAFDPSVERVAFPRVDDTGQAGLVVGDVQLDVIGSEAPDDRADGLLDRIAAPRAAWRASRSVASSSTSTSSNDASATTSRPPTVAFSGLVSRSLASAEMSAYASSSLFPATSTPSTATPGITFPE